MSELNKRTGGGEVGRRVVLLEELTVEMWGAATGTYLKSVTLPEGLLWKDVELALMDCYESSLTPNILKIVGEKIYGLSGYWGWKEPDQVVFSGSVLSITSQSSFYRPVAFLAVMKS